MQTDTSPNRQIISHKDIRYRPDRQILAQTGETDRCYGQTDASPDRQILGQTDRQTDTQTDASPDIQILGQTDRQTERQMLARTYR